MRMLDVYADFAETELALPVVRGEKSAAERFAGADSTYSIEALMPDGKALQSGTSHFLGQNFARAFDIDFLDQDGAAQSGLDDVVGHEHAHPGRHAHGARRRQRADPAAARGADPGRSWCRSRRSRKTSDASSRTSSTAARASFWTAAFGPRPTGRDKRPGWKFNEWELKGVPVRLEVGPRDLQTNQVTLVRRDTRDKEQVSVDGAVDRVADAAGRGAAGPVRRAPARFATANTHTAETTTSSRRSWPTQRGFHSRLLVRLSRLRARASKKRRARRFASSPKTPRPTARRVHLSTADRRTRRALFAQSY